MYSNSASLNIESASEPSWLFGSVLCCRPNLKFQLFFGSHSATVPKPLLARPSTGLFTSASLMNCVVSSFAAALRSKCVVTSMRPMLKPSFWCASSVRSHASRTLNWLLLKRAVWPLMRLSESISCSGGVPPMPTKSA